MKKLKGKKSEVRHQLNVELPPELLTRLDKYVEQTGFKKARAVRNLLEVGLNGVSHHDVPELTSKVSS